MAFGAHGQQGQFNFDAWRVSVAEAVAKSGGLNDTLADPASVFLYRGETREVATQLGVDVPRFEGPIIPVIYNINFRDPAGYFLATKMQMRNKDVHLHVQCAGCGSCQGAAVLPVGCRDGQRSDRYGDQCLRLEEHRRRSKRWWRHDSRHDNDTLMAMGGTPVAYELAS